MFGGLFGKSKPKPKVTLAPLSPTLAATILNVVGARSITSMPGAAQNAFQLATDPNADARDFIEVIESDEALSGRILKIANSVYFDRGNKSTNIEESVNVIGINELRCLLNANTLSDIFPSKHPYRAQLWKNDIATALIAKQLALVLNPSKADVAFLGGLMHDIGKLLLLQRSPDDYSRVLSLIEKEGLSFCEAEAQLFPFDHTQVGQLIAEKWNFSAELTEVITSHHRPWEELNTSDGTICLALLIKSADTIAHALGLGHGRGMAKFQRAAEEDLSQVWIRLGVSQPEQVKRLSELKRAYDSEYDLYVGNVTAH